MKANSIESPPAGDGKTGLEWSSVWTRLQLAMEGLLLFPALCLRSEFKQGSVCFPARKQFSKVEVVNECLYV